MSDLRLLDRLTHYSALRRHELLLLDGAQGTQIRVDRGSLWVTLEHDLRDIILSKGMCFEIDRPGRTIVAAEADTALRLSAPLRIHERIAAWLSRAATRLLNDWLRRRLSRRVTPLRGSA